jgi:phenylpyruvate tautomerase PptA (4-oxalocrotonate tautomerase family)
MPISIVATEGLLTEQAQAESFAQLTNLFLELHGLAGNQFLTPNVIGSVVIVPNGKTFSGGKPSSIVMVEAKLPSFALSSEEQKKSFVERATDIIHDASGREHPKERIYVNVVYAVDGLWGIGGKAYSNAEMGAAVGQG